MDLTPITPAPTRGGPAPTPHRLTFVPSLSIDTQSTESPPPPCALTHEHDLLETILRFYSSRTHDEIRTELQTLAPHPQLEEMCSGVMRQRITTKTIYRCAITAAS